MFHTSIPQQTIHAIARGEQLEGFGGRQEELLSTDEISQNQSAEILSPIQIIHQSALSLDDLAQSQQNESSDPSYVTTEVVTIKKSKFGMVFLIF